MSDQPDLLRRAAEYCQAKGLIIGRRLGSGVHGSVLEVESQTGKSAIKVHRRELDYRRERDVYRRLMENQLTDLRGCAVPEVLNCDDSLWVLEMTIVTRPFVLDFAGAFLDEPPDFSDEVLADWHAEKREQFGPRWGEVQAILRELENYGVFMVDVNPGNVALND